MGGIEVRIRCLVWLKGSLSQVWMAMETDREGKFRRLVLVRTGEVLEVLVTSGMLQYNTAHSYSDTVPRTIARSEVPVTCSRPDNQHMDYDFALFGKRLQFELVLVCFPRNLKNDGSAFHLLNTNSTYRPCWSFSPVPSLLLFLLPPTRLLLPLPLLLRRTCSSLRPPHFLLRSPPAMPLANAYDVSVVGWQHSVCKTFNASSTLLKESSLYPSRVGRSPNTDMLG